MRMRTLQILPDNPHVVWKPESLILFMVSSSAACVSAIRERKMCRSWQSRVLSGSLHRFIPWSPRKAECARRKVGGGFCLCQAGQSDERQERFRTACDKHPEPGFNLVELVQPLMSYMPLGKQSHHDASGALTRWKCPARSVLFRAGWTDRICDNLSHERAQCCLCLDVCNQGLMCRSQDWQQGVLLQQEERCSHHCLSNLPEPPSLRLPSPSLSLLPAVSKPHS